ncbi:uncharacterized protein [Periplaneta americana]|uniref:uncharacterized protein n=1 Tax=Periplaneta americana TaxID=6978 RepID=UPI0037E6FD0D
MAGYPTTIFEEEAILLAAVMEDEEREGNRTRRRFWIRDIGRLRGIHGEFHHLIQELHGNNEEFKSYFRLNQEQFHELLSIIEDDIKKKCTNWRESITPKERLAICLRYLVTGDRFKTIAYSYRTGASTVSSIVNDVCEAIWNRLQDKVLRIPSEEKWKLIAKDFEKLWNFPNCLGAIDGKHVLIRAPSNSGTTFYNYKKTFSIVLLAVVDAHYRFTVIDVGAEGRNSDGGVFSNSVFGKALKDGSLNIPADEPLVPHGQSLPFVFVGDEAFPLKRYLMRPFPRDQVHNNEPKSVFNYRLSRARRIVENTFGILVSQWGVYEKPFRCRVELVDKIVKATCVLHNYMRQNIYVTPVGQCEQEILTQDACLDSIPRVGCNATQEAFNVRQEFMRYFMNEGSVPWQIAYVHRGRNQD